MSNVDEKIMDNNLDYDPLFFEKVIIKLLFQKSDIRDKILPFLSYKIFHSVEAQRIIKESLLFNEKYKSFPTTKELLVDIYDEKTSQFFNDALLFNIDNYTNQHLLDKTENFIKQSLLYDEFATAVDSIDNNKISTITNLPDKLREIFSFSFNTNIGLDLFSEDGEDSMYEFFHTNDKIIPTNIPYLNNVIKGGFHEKSLTLFLAATNVGKSAVMCALTCESLIQNKKVLYITLEMEKRMIGERILANLFDIDINDIPLLTRIKFKEKYNSVRSIVKHNLIIEEFPTKSINANNIRNLLKELVVKKNFIPDICFIDYIGLMTPINLRKDENSYSEQKRVSEEIRGVAYENSGLSIVSAVQTNRDGAESADIDLTNIADSFGTAATADLIIGITQSEEMRSANKYTWIVLKNRYGFNKIKFKVCIDFPKMKIFPDDVEMEKLNAKQIKVKDTTSIAKNIAIKTLSQSRLTSRINKTVEFK